MGHDPIIGRQVQRSITGKTQKEVAQKMREMAVKVDRGTYQAPSNQAGSFLSYRTVYDCFKRVMVKIGAPSTRFHDASVIMGLSRQALAPQGVALI